MSTCLSRILIKVILTVQTHSPVEVRGLIMILINNDINEALLFDMWIPNCDIL